MSNTNTGRGGSRAQSKGRAGAGLTSWLPLEYFGCLILAFVIFPWFLQGCDGAQEFALASVATHRAVLERLRRRWVVSSNPNAFTRDVTRYLWALLEKLRRPSWSREHRLRRSRSSSRGPALNPRQENLRRAHSGPSDAGSTATELPRYGVLRSSSGQT